MKILHIHTTMQSGGVEAMVCGLANEMANNHEVTVCSIFEPRADDVFWNKLNPIVHRITIGKKKQGFSLKTILKIRELIKDGNFDAVNMHGFFQYYFLAIFTLRIKTKFFYTVHSDASKESNTWGKFLFLLKKRAFEKGSVFPITISPASNDSFRLMYGMDGKMIENGVVKPIIKGKPNEIDHYRLTNKTKVFLHPGRINEAKNQIVLCRVFDTLIKEGFDVVLIIAGGNHDKQIFDIIKTYFCDRIIYLGELNNIPDLLSRCDGMCLPSIWEGLPVTLLEALAVGCIPICSPVGGIVNVVQNGENGILSQSSSYDDYLKSMRAYLSLTNEQLSSMKEKVIKTFDLYDIAVTARKYLDYYSHCINKISN